MKIVVCINHVPDTSSQIKISSDSKGIIEDGIAFTINPYDEYAIEEAIRCKEKFGGDVTIISIGIDRNKDAIRKAIALGADEGILLKTSERFDSFGAAYLLADEIKSLTADIVFMGKQSVDYDNSSVGILTAELLQFECIPECISLEINDKDILAVREIEGGKEKVSSKLPVIITCQKGLNEPRYASLKGIMNSKKKVIIEKVVSPPALRITALKIVTPPNKSEGILLGEGVSAVAKLVDLLKNEIRVI